MGDRDGSEGRLDRLIGRESKLQTDNGLAGKDSPHLVSARLWQVEALPLTGASLSASLTGAVRAAYVGRSLSTYRRND